DVARRAADVAHRVGPRAGAARLRRRRNLRRQRRRLHLRAVAHRERTDRAGRRRLPAEMTVHGQLEPQPWMTLAATQSVMAALADFTMNALDGDASGALFDPTGGLADLHARRVRFVGEPSQRIQEDYLRILRFFRIFAHYGRPPADTAALDACRAHADGLRKL